MMLLKHPEAPIGAKVAVFASSYAVAGTVAVLRVVAGRHFWTDVLVGSAVGITIGTLVPLLHAPFGFWR